MTGLAEAVQNAVGQPSTVRIGIVESLNPTVISAQGVPFEDVGFIDGYVPVLGDTVPLLGQCSDAGSDPASWLALGRVQSASTPVQFQAGIVNVTVTAAASATLVVSFPVPFVTTPAIAVNINSGSGATSQWHSRAINAVPNGFTIFLFGPASTFTVPVMWQAQAVTT